MTDAIIHLRVPAPLKAAWVCASRAAGLRLTDWITQRVQAGMLDHEREPVHHDAAHEREPEST